MTREEEKERAKLRASLRRSLSISGWSRMSRLLELERKDAAAQAMKEQAQGRFEQLRTRNEALHREVQAHMGRSESPAACKGSWAIGNNCGTCAKCEATKPSSPPPAAPARETEQEFRPGLPPEALRKICAEWESEVDRCLFEFAQDGLRFRWRERAGSWGRWFALPASGIQDHYRPHGKTWAEIEAMAAELLTGGGK